MDKILVSGLPLRLALPLQTRWEIPCTDPAFLKWKEEGVIVPVCPEVFGGLPTRGPIPSASATGFVACTGQDVTDEYEAGALEAVAPGQGASGGLRDHGPGQPSCGSKQIYDGTFTDTRPTAGAGRPASA
jgi:uncharacterized protein YbbK (DUF523 family)